MTAAVARNFIDILVVYAFKIILSNVHCEVLERVKTIVDNFGFYAAPFLRHMPRMGLEPTTFAFAGQNSIQLSYLGPTN